MINLFHIPNYKVDTSKFNNMIHGDIVDEFTENFCKYVGVKYGCPVDCCTNAIYLVVREYTTNKYNVPTIMTPVVPQAFINAGTDFTYIDDTDWVGHAYYLSQDVKGFDIIDSAQEVQHRTWGFNDIVVYSFYPTKPVGSSDGGMICSNNKKVIDYFRTVSVQGTRKDNSSWNGRRYVGVGWKMYLNSFQAYIANENLKKLDEKKEALQKVCATYNDAFALDNFGHHLYRIRVRDNVEFLKYMKQNGICCGIHYECCHNMRNGIGPILPDTPKTKTLLKSEQEEQHTASIPFHEKLTPNEINKVIQCVKAYGLLAN